jgi:hypothetical protein
MQNKKDKISKALCTTLISSSILGLAPFDTASAHGNRSSHMFSSDIMSGWETNVNDENQYFSNYINALSNISPISTISSDGTVYDQLVQVVQVKGSGQNILDVLEVSVLEDDTISFLKAGQVNAALAHIKSVSNDPNEQLARALFAQHGLIFLSKTANGKTTSKYSKIQSQFYEEVKSLYKNIGDVDDSEVIDKAYGAFLNNYSLSTLPDIGVVDANIRLTGQVAAKEALSIRTVLDDQISIVDGQWLLGLHSLYEQDFNKANVLFEQSLTGASKLGLKDREAWSKNYITITKSISSSSLSRPESAIKSNSFNTRELVKNSLSDLKRDIERKFIEGHVKNGFVRLENDYSQIMLAYESTN